MPLQEIKLGYQELPIEQVLPSKWNPRQRIDEKKLAELTVTVRRRGIESPLLARPAEPGYCELGAGHRRRLAALAAGLGKVPIIVKAMDDEAFLELLSLDNIQHEDPHPLEEAEGFERLLKLKGYTMELLAEKIGKSESYITKRLQFAKLIEPLRQAFLEDRIQIAHAVQLARLEPKDQKRAFEQELFSEETEWDGKKNLKVADITISPSALKAWIESEIYLDLAKAAFSKDDAKLLPKAGACTACGKRTGANLALFDDTKKGDHCLDAACFHQKQNAHLVQIQAVAKKSGRMLVRMSTRYGEKDAVYASQAKFLKPTEFCDAKEEGIYVDGPLVGTTRFLCRSQSCKKHANQRGGERTEKSFTEVWAGKKQRLDDQVKQETQAEVWRQIVSGVPEEFYRDHMLLVGEKLIDRTPHDGRRVLCAALSLPGEKGPHSTDFSKPLEGYLLNLADKDIPGFLVGLSLIGYSDFNMGDMNRLAKLLDVDAIAIATNVAAPLRAEFEKKRARAAEANIKKLREAKRAAGVAAAKTPVDARNAARAKQKKRDAKKAAANDADRNGEE